MMEEDMLGEETTLMKVLLVEVVGAHSYMIVLLGIVVEEKVIIICLLI